MIKRKRNNLSLEWKILIVLAELAVFFLCVIVAYILVFERIGEMESNSIIVTNTNTPISTSKNHPTATITKPATSTITQTASPTITKTPIATLPNSSEAACIPPQNQREIGQVVQVIDGETIMVNFDDGNHQIHYIGIDTPENGTKLGIKAFNQNISLVADQWVTLIKDISESDQENQLLRYVFVGDIFVNYELIRLGYATAKIVPPDITCGLSLHQAQRIAQKNEDGIWKPTSTPFPTAKPAPTSGCIIMVTCDCSGDIYDCKDFNAQLAAQGCFNYCRSFDKGDIHNLDPEGNGIACEHLP